MMMMMISENHSCQSRIHATAIMVLTNPYSELSLSRPAMPTKGGGAVLTIHQSCDRGEGEDKDSQRGHITGPSWLLHLPAGFLCTQQGLQNVQEFNIIILSQGKTNKAEFLKYNFPSDTGTSRYDMWIVRVTSPTYWILYVDSQSNRGKRWGQQLVGFSTWDQCAVRFASSTDGHHPK